MIIPWLLFQQKSTFHASKQREVGTTESWFAKALCLLFGALPSTLTLLVHILPHAIRFFGPCRNSSNHKVTKPFNHYICSESLLAIYKFTKYNNNHFIWTQSSIFIGKNTRNHPGTSSQSSIFTQGSGAAWMTMAPIRPNKNRRRGHLRVQSFEWSREYWCSLADTTHVQAVIFRGFKYVYKDYKDQILCTCSKQANYQRWNSTHYMQTDYIGMYSVWCLQSLRFSWHPCCIQCRLKVCSQKWHKYIL